MGVWGLGTSPRTWGKGTPHPFFFREIRNIPTHVGKRTGSPFLTLLSQEHPHARGEKPHPLTFQSCCSRNIPTHVGKRQFEICPEFFPGEHPHARGEKKRSEARTSCFAGNIPTHVGKSHEGLCPFDPQKEHPHARGEKASKKSGCNLEKGTSPRTWGKVAAVQKKCTSPGNIPTHVGKSFNRKQRLLFLGEHPHARGEKSRLESKKDPVRGTSPRTWGKGLPKLHLLFHFGNIPTHVGKRYSV